MARPTLPKALAELIAKLEPELRDAFLAAMDDLRNAIDYRALEAALEARDIDAAIAALNIDPGAFSQYVAERTSAYAQAGSLSAAYIPTDQANSISFRFDMTNPRAERWIREQAAERVTGYIAEQKETARRVIAEGFVRGDGSRRIALDIAGRIERGSNRRTGGIIGLSDPQAGYVESMRARLASGDPLEMRKVLGRFNEGRWVKGTGMTLRDRRFDAEIKRAIRDGRPVPQAKIAEMTARYADRLLAQRGLTVAQLETAQSVIGARQESYQQAIEKEGLPPEAVTKGWRHQGAFDEDARTQHVAMNGKEVVGLYTPFVLPDGTMMQHPHDPAGGVKHNISCQCDAWYSINWLWGVA